MENESGTIPSKRQTIEIFGKIKPRSIITELQGIDSFNFDHELQYRTRVYKYPTSGLRNTKSRRQVFCPKCENTNNSEGKLETTGA